MNEILERPCTLKENYIKDSISVSDKLPASRVQACCWSILKVRWLGYNLLYLSSIFLVSIKSINLFVYRCQKCNFNIFEYTYCYTHYRIIQQDPEQI